MKYRELGNTGLMVSEVGFGGEWLERHEEGESVDLIKYAHKLDTTNTAIAYYYGYLLILKDNTSKENMERGLALMKRHVDAHPEDYYEATYFSDVCMGLDHKDMGLATIEKQAELKPNNTEVQMRLAAAYVRNEKYEQALKN